MMTPIPNNLAPDDSPAVDTNTTIAAPTSASVGLRTRNHKNLHLLLEPTGGTSVGLQIWVRFKWYAEWALLTSFGTAGTKTVTTANGREYVIVPIEGADEVFFAVPTNADPVTLKVFAAGNTVGD